jgi:hypothetical protein
MTPNRTVRLRAALCAFALALLIAAPPLAADDDVRVRTLEQDLPAAGVRAVSFHGPVGELDVEATGGDTVRIRIVFQCDEDSSRCRNAAEDVELEVRRRGDLLHLELEDWPKIGSRGLSVEAEVEIPRDLALEIDWGVGEIDVDGMEGDLEVDLGVGEITVRTAEAAVSSVEMDVGVGEVELRVGGRSIEGDGFVGRSLRWSRGPGAADVELDSGVGEILVELR